MSRVQSRHLLSAADLSLDEAQEAIRRLEAACEIARTKLAT